MVEDDDRRARHLLLARYWESALGFWSKDRCRNGMDADVCGDNDRTGTNPKGCHRLYAPRRSWRFIRRWCVASTPAATRRWTATRP